jgi:hypothetical protein
MKPQILERLLADVNGATFISIDTVTPVTLTGGKKNPLQGRVTKQTVGSSVMVFSNQKINGYEAMVNRRLTSEGKGSFEVGPRQWGTRVPNTPFVTHKDQSYLEVIFLKPGDVQYLVDGAPFNDVIDGLTEKPEGEQGGLDNKVFIRTINTLNVKAITVNKHRFVE